jgi:hypothetical protein
MFAVGSDPDRGPREPRPNEDSERMMTDRGPGHGTFDMTPEDLLDDFGSWAVARGLDVDLFVIDAALDLTEGDRVSWTAHDIHQLLLERFPRRVTMAEADWPDVLATLHGWVDFVTDRQPTRSADAAALHAEIDRNRTAFLTAMADERNYGVAKFWTTRMLQNGVDPDDETEVRRFLARARNGEIDYDQDVLTEIMLRGSLEGEIDDFESEDGEDSPLPPVSLPAADELTTLASAVALVSRLRVFLTWVGTGRTVTSTKPLRVADSTELAEVLEVDQPYLEHAHGGADLPEVNLLVQWAKSANLVHVVKGRLVGVKVAAGLPDRPLDLWRRAFDAFPTLGPALCSPTSHSGPSSLLEQRLPDVVSALWLSLYTAGGTPVPVEMLVDITRETLVEPMALTAGDVIVDAREVLWRRELAAVLSAMELLGAVELTTSTDPVERDKLIELSGNDDPDLTLVRLTPLGLWGVRNALRAEGFDAPVIEDLAGEPVGELCDALNHASPAVTDAALTAWVAARGEEPAAAELAAFSVDAPSSSARLVATNGLAHAGAAGVEHARRLRSTGGVAGAVATTWLIQHSVLDQNDATEQELGLALVDNFAAMREHGVLIDQLTTYPEKDQFRFVTVLANTEHPGRSDLLAAIATEHPEQPVAAAARRVLDSPR